MATFRFNQAQVDALKSRKSAYDVRDRDLKGFGVRVLTAVAAMSVCAAMPRSIAT